MTSQRLARVLAAVAGTTLALGMATAGAAEGDPVLNDVTATLGEKTFEIYGFAQLDYIQDFNRVTRTGNATLRPIKIPTSGEPYGSDGQAILSVAPEPPRRER